MRRPGAALIAVRAVDAFKVYLPFMLLQGGFAERLPAVAHLPWAVFVWAYSLSRIPVVLLDWATLGHRFTPDGLAHRSGWPARTVTTTAWTDVTSLAVEQDAIHRALGRHRVTVGLGASSRPDLVLEALSSSDLEELRGYVAAAHTDTATQRVRVVGPATSPTGLEAPEVSRTSWRDLLVIAVTHGQVALVVPFAVSAYYEIGEWVALPGEATIWEWLRHTGPWGLAGGLVLGLFYGLARAWLAFGGHRVTVTGGTYRVERAAVSRSAQAAGAADVLGVRIDRNPLMVALGLASLHLVQRRAPGSTGAMTVLPVARVGTVARHASALLPGYHPPPTRAHPGPPLLAGLVASVLAVAFLAAHQPWAAALVLLGGAAVANRVATSIAVGQGRLTTFHRGWWSTRTYVVAPEALREVGAWGVRCRERRLVAVRVLDQGPRTLLGASVPLATVGRLRALATDR